jgi:hypothetical protein
VAEHQTVPAPVQTSILQEHAHRLRRPPPQERRLGPGLEHDTRRGVRIRVTTSSRSDFRSAVVRVFMWVGSLSLLPSIGFLPPFQCLDNRVQLVEACVPELAVRLDGLRKGATHGGFTRSRNLVRMSCIAMPKESVQATARRGVQSPAAVLAIGASPNYAAFACMY